MSKIIKEKYEEFQEEGEPITKVILYKDLKSYSSISGKKWGGKVLELSQMRSEWSSKLS